MSLEAFQLNGKNALVTGSHKGLGAAIAVALAKAGANVGCHGRDPNPGSACDEVRAAGFKTFYFSGDLADAEVPAVLIEKTIAEFGSIDILVNNAGTIRRAPAAEYPTEFWDELIAVNLTAVFHLSQLAARHMLARGTGGKILNMSPAERWGAPQDITGAAIFLCSSASDYVHGHVLAVDGGWLAR